MQELPAPLHPDTHRPQKTATEDKVPRHEKALYGLGSPSMGLVDQIIQYQVQQVLVYGLGMSPALNSMIVMIFRIVDALTDPVMGWISDNARTRFGRRRPFMFLGCLLMALILPFVWRFNEHWDMIWIAVWFVIFGILMSTATTIYNIPYQSLKMEMTPDYNERTSVNVYSGIVITLFGLISPWVWKLTQQPFFTGQLPGEEPNTLLGIRNIAIWFAGLVLIIGMIPTFVCKERYYAKAQKQKKEPFLRSLGLTFKSRPFLMMLALIFTMNLEGLVTGMGGYISLYYVFGGDKVFAATFTGVAGTIGGFLGFFSIPFFGKLATRFGKERSLLVVTVAHIVMAGSIWFCYNPKLPWLAVIPVLLNGLLIAGLWTVVPSMKADIVDDDEVRTGERREGSFESVFSWFQKFTGTVFTGISGFVVIAAGFQIKLGAAQADGVFTRMILMMSLIPMALGIIQCILIIKWPLTAGRMGEIRQVLEARRGKIDMSGGRVIPS
ncbi:MAG: MFS transporter [Verrucomicrobia bacterium]|jgi:GPH family glycoside/pentoside/hexuronide:cation symporter|nr:MFS transporter [Verrucomicrobiota bacterium]